MIPTPLYRRSLFGVESFSDGVTALFHHRDCTGKILLNAGQPLPESESAQEVNLIGSTGGWKATVYS